MADSVISTLVRDVVGRLTSAAIQEYGLLRSLKNDLSALGTTFKRIQAVLRDAEKKQTTQEAVKEWLKTLRSASLEAENVLDEAKTEAMIQRLHREMGKKYKIRAFFTSRYNPLMVKTRIAHKVKNVRKKLEDIDASKSEFQLIESKDGAGNAGDISKWETTSPLPQVIYGRDKDKAKIVDKICNQNIGITHDNENFRVYAIYGMGGIGKTTLAQYAYNHEKVKTHFELKCWVYVSTVFDVKRIIKAICGLEDSSMEDMIACLQNKLQGKKFFIVMDDVWIETEDMKKWEELCKAFSCGAKGSTVIATTRKEVTAQLMAKIPELHHNVGDLSEEESWSLFKMLAFPGGGERKNQKELEVVGKEIVNKCNGLPLAVKTLGILMSTKKKEVNEWQLVNDNFVSEIQDNDILPALKLSYDELLPHMRRCFAYCCVFSKGEEMSKDLLIELWMANGFIDKYVDGERILSCLVQRLFFQDVVEEGYEYTGEICKMHDLMHDLAKSEMGNDSAVIEPGKELITSDEVLHLSLLCNGYEFSKQDLRKIRSVRSMLVFNEGYTSNIRQISNHVYLRVLYLNKIESSTLPKSICKLIHLRYLKISWSDIQVLPESIINLQNLQVLILEECSQFRELPKGLRYMKNLQHLEAGYSLRHMPVGIKELTHLRRLSQFVVGKDVGARIGELGNLNLLGWKLSLSGLENVGGLRDAKSANLKDKTNLKSLRLEWSHDYHRPETFDSEVLEGLEPNSGLHELNIWNYMGRVLFLNWLVKLVNLTSIGFIGVDKCEQLPPLGKLPSLKRIELFCMQSLKCFHDDDDATSKDEILFPNLQELEIIKCSALVSLPSNFPKLTSLTILFCDELRSLPDEIQSFNDLNEITIENCEILSRRCEKDVGEDWSKISHIPHLDIELPRDTGEN